MDPNTQDPNNPPVGGPAGTPVVDPNAGGVPVTPPAQPEPVVETPETPAETPGAPAPTTPAEPTGGTDQGGTPAAPAGQ